MKRRKTGPSPKERQEVLERAAGHCERCGIFTLTGQIHHLKPRGMGGSRDPMINDPSNLAYLDEDCHREIESERTKAYESGWLIKRGSITDGSVVMEQGRGT